MFVVTTHTHMHTHTHTDMHCITPNVLCALPSILFCAECPDLSLDMVLVIDASFSLEDDSYQMAKDFAASLLDNFTLGADVRVSVITYGFEVLTDLHLNNILTKDAIQNRIRSLPRPRHFRATRTSRVLQVTTDEFIGYGRFDSNVVQVMVLLTDEVLTDMPFLQQSLDRARKGGFIRYVVGILPLKEAAMNELHMIAGDPRRVFLGSAEGLQELGAALSQCQTCGYC